MKNARNISSKTIKSLYAHSGNTCAFPGCNQVLAYNEELILSNICHIYGLNPGSARYDETKGDEGYLNSEENLILLCPTHHALIDKDEANFPVETLKAIKSTWELFIKESLSSKISYNTSSINYDIEAIFDYYVNEIGNREITKDEIKKEVEIFSKQSLNVKTVMMKILDVVHDDPQQTYGNLSGYDFNMMSVINELAGGMEDKLSIIKYLMDRNYIEESRYNGYTERSFYMTEDGTYIDLSKNYHYRIENGLWSVLHKGQILDAVYRTNHML